MSSRITEKFEYKTDIIESYNGREQRIKLRQYPRHLVTYNYDTMLDKESQWLKAHLRLKQTAITYIPMWQNTCSMINDLPTGKALYVKEESLYGFLNCDAIEIFTTDDTMQFANKNYQKKVSGYSENGGIFLKKMIHEYLPKNSFFITPLLRCSVQRAEGMLHNSSDIMTASLNFEEILQIPHYNIPQKFIYEFEFGTKQFNRYKLPVQFLDKEVFLFEPSWEDTQTNNIDIAKNYEKIDNETGMTRFDLKNKSSYDTHTFNIVLRDKKMINNMIRFFKRVGGKYKSFYCTSWVNDFKIVDDISSGDNALYTELSTIAKYYSDNTREKYLVIFLKDWRSIITKVVAYGKENIGGKNYGKILLSEGINENIKKENIAMISYLNLVRLDSDDLIIDYETVTVAKTSLIFKEVDV